MKPFQDDAQLLAFLQSEPDCAHYISLFAMAAFARDARYLSDYSADVRWQEAIVLTDEGLELTRSLEGELGIPTPDLKMAALGYLSHHDFLVDPKKTDIQSVRELVQGDLLNGRAHLAYGYGRTLYDKFNDLYPQGSVRQLTAEATMAFLHDTPQGVYQLATLVTGPFGILTSQTTRYLPPRTHDLYLWHSQRRGAIRRHRVTLDIHNTAIARAYAAIEERAMKLGGPPSQWTEALTDVCRPKKGSADHLLRGIPLLLADCVVPEERTRFLAHVLESGVGKSLREILSSPPRKRALAQGPSEQVAKRLSPEEQLQLLLLLPDATLAKLLDDACRSRVLAVPEFEVRSPGEQHEFYRLVRDRGQPKLHLGTLGVRPNDANPALRLAMTLVSAFTRAGALDDLAWKIRAKTGTPIPSEILDFMRKEGPASTVQKLALVSRPVLDAVLDTLLIAYGDGDEQRLVREILWKTGFSIPEIDPTLGRLNERLAGFKRVVLSVTDTDTEEARERLRSTGVNLFVSVEEFLEAFVAYNVWLLDADLHNAQALAYSHSDGLRAVAQVLSDWEIPEETSPWDPGGRNTLGTLLAYLAVANKWIAKELTAEQREQLRRAPDELPDYDEWACGRPYAFAYKKVWANCEQDALAGYRRRFSEVASLIARADVAGARNGLDHKRAAGAFPTGDRLSSFVLHFEQALELAQLYRLYPKEFYLERRTDDRYGLSESHLVDLRGTRVELLDPPIVVGLQRAGVIAFEHPILVAPDGILGSGRQSLCLRRSRESVYSTYWSGYPRIRPSLPPEEPSMESGETPRGEGGITRNCS